MNTNESKQKLVLELEIIEKDLNALGRQLNAEGDWVIVPNNTPEEHADPLDEANQTEELAAKVAVLNVLEQRHEQVERALRAIENETYGICEEAGCPIGKARLEANPSATTCINHTA
ncbi:MAG: TraR/DksA C4-type zinc finger protein [Candidatus Pacebacteria bacterium]|nr:TraR/DksA C4-type zinc finger protein [Candidatus Paceibacterota bacterium]